MPGKVDEGLDARPDSGRSRSRLGVILRGLLPTLAKPVMFLGHMAAQSWLILRAALGMLVGFLKTRDGVLFAVAVVYTLLLASFMERFHQVYLAKYAISLVGVFLVAVNTEVANKSHVWLRVLLIGVPTIGIMLLQLAGDRENARALQQLSEQTIQHALEHTRQLELKTRDILSQGTIDSLRNLRGADEGILIKADRFAVKALLAESRLLLQHPELQDEIFSLDTDPEQRLAGYQRLIDARHIADFQGVIDPLQLEVNNRKFADHFLSEVQSKYATLVNQSAQLDQQELCQRMTLIANDIRKLLKQYSVAVIYDQLGNIALACGQNDETLSNFYTGLSLYPTDPHLQESLVYALWIVNENSYGALSAATKFMELIEPEPAAGNQELSEAFRLLNEVEKADPARALIVDRRIAGLRRRFDGFEPRWDHSVQNWKDRAVNQYAYFSALQGTNGPRARELMKSLFDRDNLTKSDPEYGDTWGFVLMRFHRNEQDLDEAKRLFTYATQHRRPETTTYGLAANHLKELEALREDLASK